MAAVNGHAIAGGLITALDCDFRVAARKSAEEPIATLSPGHAAVRYTNPTTGGDVLPTIRCEMHRVRAGARTQVRREVGSSVFQVFDGAGRVSVGDRGWDVARGDMFVVQSWAPFKAEASGETALDLFRFGDAPIFEALNMHRFHVGD